MLFKAVAVEGASSREKTYRFDDGTGPVLTVSFPSSEFFISATRYPTLRMAARVTSGTGRELASGSFCVRVHPRGGWVVAVEGFAGVPPTATVRIAQIAAQYNEDLARRAAEIDRACRQAVAACYGLSRAQGTHAQATGLLTQATTTHAEALDALRDLGLTIDECP